MQYELKELKRRQEDDERQRAEELAAQQAALAALHSPPEGSHHDQYVKSVHFVASSILIFLFLFFISRTDGDTSPSEPISGSTDKDPTTEATEGKILFDFLNAHELGDCDSFYTNPIWDFFSFLFNSFAAQKPLTTQRESFT